MAQHMDTGSNNEVGTGGRRRWLAAGLLAAGLLVSVGISVPFWLEAVREDITFDVPPGGVSLLSTALNGFVTLLPGVVALVGLVRTRAWGPSATLANGLLVVAPALLAVTSGGSQGRFAVAAMVAYVLLLAAAGVAATLLRWSATAPTPARALLWLGAGAVIAGRFLPVSAEGRGAESLMASVVRFGGTSGQFVSVAVGVAALVAIAIVVDRLPPRAGAGAAAVLAAGGLAPLSPTLMTWLANQAISPLAALGPVGAVALVTYLGEVRQTPPAGEPLKPATPLGQAR